MKVLLSISTSVLLGTIACSEQWDTVPLGDPAAITQPEEVQVLHPIRSGLRIEPVSGEDLLLSDQGKAHYVLILPSSPSQVERRAMDLLQSTLQQITGVEFETFREQEIELLDTGFIRGKEGKTWTGGIWIGATQQAIASGLDTSTLLPEGFILRTLENQLFILGNDDGQQGRRVNGTYFAATDLLERHFGVRWLWPGELGTVIPQRPTLTLTPLNEQNEPAIRQRTIRNLSLNRRAEAGLARLKAEPQEYSKVLQEASTWLMRQKVGSSMRLRYGHTYSDWYEQYGSDHPDWFALQPNGSRTQQPERARLCKSNPEVAAEMARRVLLEYQNSPNLDSYSISPNDGSGSNHFCMCEECRKLDPANGPTVELLFSRDGKRFFESYPSLSDRMAVFYNRIAEQATSIHPEIRLGAYAYSAYRDAPIQTTLHPSITIGFVGLVYDNEHYRNLDVQRWNQWSLRASQLVLRPNALHGGHALPFIYVQRLTEDLKHCFETGMIAADFDSLMGHWSTQGLNYYVLASLLWDPSLDSDSLVLDYCVSGFGPAAFLILEYFNKLEEASTTIANQAAMSMESWLREEEDDQTPRTNQRSQRVHSFLESYFEVFNPNQVLELRSLLEQGRQLVQSNPTVLQRIDFLEAGLNYLDLFRAVREDSSSLITRQDLLTWYRDIFRSNPQTLNSVHQLWRTGATFRGLE